MALTNTAKHPSSPMVIQYCRQPLIICRLCWPEHSNWHTSNMCIPRLHCAVFSFDHDSGCEIQCPLQEVHLIPGTNNRTKFILHVVSARLECTVTHMHCHKAKARIYLIKRYTGHITGEKNDCLNSLYVLLVGTAHEVTNAQREWVRTFWAKVLLSGQICSDKRDGKRTNLNVILGRNPLWKLRLERADEITNESYQKPHALGHSPQIAACA